ncbi:MAG: hypothetical protein ABL973_06550 [Micropepsaceae bacterium]
MQPRFAVTFTVGIVVSNLGVPGAMAAGPGVPGTQTVAITQHKDTAAIVFQGVTMTSLDPTQDGMEVTVHFSAPIQTSIAAELERISGCIAAASTGYDTLLLRTQAPAKFDVTRLADGFALNVTTLPEMGNRRKLATVEIRRRMLSDDIDGARDMLFQLRTSQPDDADLYRLEADIDAADKDYRAAAQKYEYLLRATPGDEGLQETLRASQAEFAPRVEFGLEAAEIKKADRQLRSFLETSSNIAGGLSLRGRLDYIELDDNLIQFTDGTVGPFSGDRYSAEIDAIYDLTMRWQGIVSLFGADDTIGAGALLRYADPSGSFSLSAAYHQPSWDYPESIVANGTFDSAILNISRSFADTWYFNLGVAARRYSLADENDAAISTAINAGLRWALPIESPTKITLGYAFDGEYAERISLKPDGIGGFYALLPLGDRVIHTADLRIAEQLSQTLYTSLSGGYAYDMNGEGGVVAAAELAYNPTIDLRIALNAYYSGIADRAGESGSYSHAGLTVTRIFTSPVESSDAK